MRSLRSLCLLKIYSLGQNMYNMTELPPSLAKDLKIMQLVNKSFSEGLIDFIEDIPYVCQAGLSIQYDGASWNFQYRNGSFRISCCPYCDFQQPELRQFSLDEGRPVSIPDNFPLFPQAPNLLEQMGLVDLRLVMSFEMNDEGTWGRFWIKNYDVPVEFVFSCLFAIQIGEGDERKLNCNGFLVDGIFHERNPRFMAESSVAAKDLFVTDEESYCYNNSDYW